MFVVFAVHVSLRQEGFQDFHWTEDIRIYDLMKQVFFYPHCNVHTYGTNWLRNIMIIHYLIYEFKNNNKKFGMQL